jgi:ferritin
MISNKMVDAVNGQINKEMYSAYLYMSMSAYADGEGLKGFATYFMVQYHEEMVHAMKFFEYLARQGNKITLGALDKPPVEFGTMLQMFQQTLEHERFITRSINELIDLAMSEKDYASKAFLDWYVTEQVEEEKNAVENIQKLKMIGDNSSALYLLDKELGARMLTVPSNFALGVEAQMKGTA